MSDFSSYDNDPVPFCYVCPRFSYINEAMRRQEEERQKALAQYRYLSRNLTPFDAIPVPPKIKIMASNFPTPIDITHDKDRTILIELSRIALAQFNADQVEKYQFNELVKATTRHIPHGTYYITFNATLPSNSSATTTFQAHVWDRRPLLKESPVVESCSIKT
ncbi:hypothetical protein QL285_062688 [Trifolium repens]|nr:hypothetical protein QL285_062688 [Trifolium repens]